MILLAIFVIGFFIYKNNTASKAKNKIDSYKIKRENVREILTLSGEINTEEKVTLKFQTSGRLSWVGVKEGDYVKKYQGIASLDQRDVKKTLEKKLLAFSKTRWDFDQTKDDNKDVLTDKIKRVLDKAQFDLTSSILDVELQNLTLEYSYLSSPIEGIVTHVSFPYAGVNITPAGADFEIVNPKTLYFSATAEQGDVINLKEGMTGKISLDAFLEKTYKGELYYISFLPKTGETGTVYELKLKLDEEASNLPLKLGMTGDLDFLIKEEKNALSVPSSYVKKDKKGNYVYIGVPAKKEKRYIEISDEIDGKYIITNGLTENEVIYD